ncbi:hypothetical protein AWC38_SpisGene4559 [Stylophora pistillata]|uniref:Uncharacterized protein n=1 Tax=Stylophora pistillata TaxID=50429 RepID=A0A2B4SNB4_STYPI|nr:hypothetical protein AWC38_SpisGene4559 [Stylophora pistillata]
MSFPKHSYSRAVLKPSKEEVSLSPDLKAKLLLENVTFHGLHGCALSVSVEKNVIGLISVKKCRFINNAQFLDQLYERATVKIELPNNDPPKCPQGTKENELKETVWSEKYGLPVIFEDSIFENNVGIAGVLTFLKGNVTIKNCEFKNNKGLVLGGHVYVKTGFSLLNIINCDFLQTTTSSSLKNHGRVSSIGSFLRSESTGTLEIQNSSFVTDVSDEFDPIFAATKSTAIKIDRSTSLKCPNRKQVKLENITRQTSLELVKRNDTCLLRVAYIKISCQECQDGFYSLKRGASSGLDIHKGTKCLRCPYGATCENGEIKAQENFWGFYSSPLSTKLEFHPCPLKYCKPPPPIFPWLFRQCLWFREKSNSSQRHAALHEGNDEEHDAGYLKTIFYFYQVAEILMIKSPEEADHIFPYVTRIIALFNFQVKTINGSIGCPFPGLNVVTKELFLGLKFLATLLSIAMIYAIHRVISRFRHIPKPSLKLYLAKGTFSNLVFNNSRYGLFFFNVPSYDVVISKCKFINCEKAVFMLWEGNFSRIRERSFLKVTDSKFLNTSCGIEFGPKLRNSFAEVFLSNLVFDNGTYGLVLANVSSYYIAITKSKFFNFRKAAVGILWNEINSVILEKCSLVATDSEFRYNAKSILAMLPNAIVETNISRCLFEGAKGRFKVTSDLRNATGAVFVRSQASVVIPPFRDRKANICETLSLMSLVAICTFNLAEVTLIAQGLEPAGPEQNLFYALEWIEVALLGFLPAIACILVALAALSQVIRVLYHGSRLLRRTVCLRSQF